MIIDKLILYRLKVPLKRPYKIATAEIKDYDLALVVAQAAGREAIGEAMADLKGYFWETPEEVWQFAREKGKNLPGLKLDEAKEYISGFRKDHPCAATPFLTALEMLSGAPALNLPASGASPVPLAGILQATERGGIEREIKAFIAEGYTTIKVKVGFDVEDDIRRVQAAAKAAQGKALLRVDANQGYTFPEAKRFMERIDPQHIEFFEQPFKENDWEGMTKLSRISSIPLGLDESIYGMESVEKARRLNCAQFVKFKLMKIGSAEALAEYIAKSREYGFEVILGNGAAGEISCYHEALVAGRMKTRAGEMNGFLKQRESILVESCQTRAGSILLDPGFSLKLDPVKVEKYGVERLILE